MRIVAVVLALLGIVTLPRPGFSEPEVLGKVVFPTSCDSKVQGQFERGVAMLHSYWFSEARKVFDAVVRQDPGCAIAYWGLAVNYLGNSLASAPSSKDVAAAAEGLDRARAIGAKTPRERDWIEAIGAYYRNPDKGAPNDRLVAYTKAMEHMTQRYPDDFEAWTYYALTLQASAPKTDKTYANQLKSAEILERLFKQNPEHPGVAHYLSTPTTTRRSPARASPSRGDTRGSHPPRPMPATCRHTSIRWSGCGRSPSPRTDRRSRFNPTIITRRTSWSTPISSSRRTPRPRRWST